jgi:hypothetical protein
MENRTITCIRTGGIGAIDVVVDVTIGTMALMNNEMKDDTLEPMAEIVVEMTKL